jgi:hypothetical protein
LINTAVFGPQRLAERIAKLGYGQMQIIQAEMKGVIGGQFGRGPFAGAGMMPIQGMGVTTGLGMPGMNAMPLANVPVPPSNNYTLALYVDRGTDPEEIVGLVRDWIYEEAQGAS